MVNLRTLSIIYQNSHTSIVYCFTSIVYCFDSYSHRINFDGLGILRTNNVRTVISVTFRSLNNKYMEAIQEHLGALSHSIDRQRNQ